MKTVIITGANSGLGLETAKHIARKGGYNVILACRNMEKANAAKTQIINETGCQTVFAMQIDTSSLQSVKNFVEEFKQLNVKLDCLICNAGISPMHSGTTADGFELVFATNHIGHFLLVNLLLPYVAENGRIINVTSDMHNPPDGLKWKDPDLLAYADSSDRKKYSYSKLANIYFTYELADRLQKANSAITVNAFNPGMMDTNFHGNINYGARAAMVKLTMPHRVGDLAKSSAALAEIATSGEFDGVTGKFFDRSTKFTKSSDLSYNLENRVDLWNKSIKWVGLDNEKLKQLPQNQTLQGDELTKFRERLHWLEQNDAERFIGAEPLNAVDIYNELLNNYEAARAKYFEKRIRLRGIVSKIGDDEFGAPSFEMTDSDGTRCYALIVFPSKDIYEKVKEGNLAEIIGNVVLIREPYGLVVKKCELLKIDGN